MTEETQILRRGPVFLGERNTSLFSRGMARVIDAIILVAVYFLGSLWGQYAGLIMALGLCLAQDSFWAGQSIGKRIMGLRVIEDHLGLSCGLAQSAVRNIPFFILLLTIFAPSLKIVCFLMGLPILAFEVYLVLNLVSGVRLGDILANTLVVEYLDVGLTGRAIDAIE